MSKRNVRFHPALKHGAYSNTTLLPGEDPLAFKELHDGLVAEFAPAGPAEENIILTMARLYWRKQNLSTYQLAALARKRSCAIRAKYGPRYDPNAPDPFPLLPGFDPKKIYAPKMKFARTKKRRTRKLGANSATQWPLLKWMRRRSNNCSKIWK